MGLDSHELLRAKAMLLLRREREVHELRQERSRIETWLRVYHELTLSLGASGKPGLEAQWVAAMVHALSFQAACVYAAATDGARLRLCVAAGLDSLPTDLSLDFSVLEQPSGLFDAGAPDSRAPFARALGFGRCYWFLAERRGGRLLFLAGFRTGTERFHAVHGDDMPHFTLLGSHVAALLENATLIEELDIERRELREAQERLVRSTETLAETSRRAGMADIATGVLHNVGNAANSVNVSAELIASRLAGMKVDNLGRLADLLAEHADRLPTFLTEDDRGRKVVPYLEGLGAELTSERDGLVREVSSLRDHIEHVKAIVSKQQAYAGPFDMSQAYSPVKLMDDAIELCWSSLARHEVVVARDDDEVPRLLLDRHKVLQILVNLLANAKQAVSGGGPRQIWLSVRRHDGHIRFIVRDSGIGIRAGDLDKVFRHGFTTKADGHGFGLHTSALAAGELGGSITAESAGPGFGATFTLELPLRIAPTSSVSSRSA
jgi:signal transduction histidine kinase